MKRKRYILITLVSSVLSLLLGLAMIVSTASSNNGSPFGWLFLVAGIFGLMSALAIWAGAYEPVE